ncbi:DUF262 domain-containing protein [uncultured Maribacter sp.]|uniref:GmrSD restriction endonuclease domain-containing protein n=1 Tax=uncultured Maribacter sp. TaxID=431308 RepID=UPI00262576F7|nr:DUF262 domain-containing protein [uncultured Maribacter sp.]
MPTIQQYINDRNKYKVDYNYQRPNDAWSKDDKQCLVDTILKGEPVPLFFVNYLSTEGVFYIVDGQQRLNSISQFYDNKIKLNKKYSGEENHGVTFNGDKGLNDKQKAQFLSYNLKFHTMEDYSDERVRLIFSRLQRGKPLQLGERLNAKPGKIVESMRQIANHEFLKYSVGVSQNRYGVFPDAARILFYEIHGAKQMGSGEIYNFFDTNKDLDKTNKHFRNILNVLNFLSKCFPKEPGDYKYLEKHAWILAVYTMVRELKLRYALSGQEQNLQNFIQSFHSKIYNETFRGSNTTYQRFYDNIRGGWSEKIISLRRDILIEEFLKNNNLLEFDDKRQISNEDKIAAYSNANGTCENEDCRYKFKDYKEAEYHHEELYSQGGRSELGNITVLCATCHDKVHGKIEHILNNDIERPKPTIETKYEYSNNGTSKLPIGKYVREKMAEVVDKNLLDYNEIEKLQTEYYSKNTFDIQLPFLLKVNSANPAKVERYWKKPLLIKGGYYLMCSEWYEQPQNNDRPFFNRWLRKLKE